MELITAFQRFGIALLIGLLIGLEREAAKGDPGDLAAGVRTFAIVALIGGVCGLFYADGFVWPMVAAAIGVSLFLAASYVITVSRAEDKGLTSEFAALLVFFIGALVVAGQEILGAALAIALAALLALKSPLHHFAEHVHREEMLATLKFAVVSVIILPILPNRTFGPLDVLNPRLIWLMVVFISGISFFGYVLIKLVGSNRAITLTGFLGGLVSSTALTMSFAPRSREQPQLAAPLTVAILIAATTMFPRVALEVAVVNRALLPWLAVPLAVVTVAGAAIAFVLYRISQRARIENAEFNNPFALAPAIKFGLLFAVILLLSKAAQVAAGEAGVYVAALVGGLADVDPVTLSMARLSSSGDVSLNVAAAAILLAAVTNTLVKAGIALSLGGAAMRRYLVASFGVLLLVVVVLALLVSRYPSIAASAGI